jgi:hypothetical protein
MQPVVLLGTSIIAAAAMLVTSQEAADRVGIPPQAASIAARAGILPQVASIAARVGILPLAASMVARVLAHRHLQGMTIIAPQRQAAHRQVIQARMEVHPRLAERLQGMTIIVPQGRLRSAEPHLVTAIIARPLSGELHPAMIIVPLPLQVVLAAHRVAPRAAPVVAQMCLNLRTSRSSLLV